MSVVGGRLSAYQLRLTFQEIFTLTDRHQGATLLKGWIDLAKESAQIMRCHFLIVVEAPPIVLTFLCRWCLLQIGDGLF